MKSALFIVIAFGMLLQRRIDYARAPWNATMDAMRSNGGIAAERVLENAAAHDRTLIPWERSYAWAWAGQLAQRADHLDDAERDYLAARVAEPGGYDARMATMHLGEIAIARRQWFIARRYLGEVEFDRDPLIRTYAQHRVGAVRERTRRLVLRYTSCAWLGLGAVLLAVHCIRRRRKGWAQSFGRALLLTETLGIVAAGLIPRLSNPHVGTMLSQPGWMAFLIPYAVTVALLWASRRIDGPRRWYGVALILVAMLVTAAAGLYVAFDYTWWSVEHPIVG